MSKTHRFNATINLGGKSYPPGSDVPVGGKNGLEGDEIGRLEREFGKWQGKSLSQEEQLARLTAENRDLEASLRRAEKIIEQVEVLSAEKSKLQASLRQAEKVGEQVEVLSAEKRDLQASVLQLENDNQVLAARVSELENGAGGGSA